MTPPLKREGPQEATPEDLARWERYGRFVEASKGSEAMCMEVACSIDAVRWAEEEHLKDLDALAEIMTEHCRLRANADPFLTCDPDD